MLHRRSRTGLSCVSCDLQNPREAILASAAQERAGKSWTDAVIFMTNFFTCCSLSCEDPFSTDVVLLSKVPFSPNPFLASGCIFEFPHVQKSIFRAIEREKRARERARESALSAHVYISSALGFRGGSSPYRLSTCCTEVAIKKLSTPPSRCNCGKETRGRPDCSRV